MKFIHFKCLPHRQRHSKRICKVSLFFCDVEVILTVGSEIEQVRDKYGGCNGPVTILTSQKGKQNDLH